MKLFSKISDKIYRSTDKFFQGNTIQADGNDPNFKGGYGEEHVMVWELNQGIEDIVMKDLQAGYHLLLPSMVRFHIEKMFKSICLYFLVDAVIEDETLEQETDRVSRLKLISTPVAKQIMLTREIKNRVSRKILSLQDWLKIKMQKLRVILSHLQKDKPYYLLGNFAPARFDISGETSIFRHTSIFHLRN
jgi:hypothetical protein